MQRGFQLEIQRIVLLGIGSLIFGYLNGYPLTTLLVGGGAYMLWTFNKILRIYRWLDTGARGLPPDATGVWGDISDQLYRLQKRSLKSQQSLRSLAVRVQKITSALEDGILILDSSRSLVWWNPAATTMLSLQTSDHDHAIMNLVRDPRFVEFINQTDFDEPLEITTPGSERKTLLYTAAAFGDDEVVLVVRDVTRLRDLEEMRKEFVGNISHELRTPLTVISGYIENLSLFSDQLPTAMHKALNQMQQQTERMSSLANDLVMLSKLESLDEMSTSNPVPLQPMLEQIAIDAKALSGGRHSINHLPGSEVSLLGDATQLQSAISNLVFNAVRHNPEGTDITISTELNNDGVTVHVSDNGNGIDPEHLPRLTERFYRVDASRASESGGTGLGLAIVKHVLLRHDASLNIESVLSNGSTFSCHFPVTRIVGEPS